MLLLFVFWEGDSSFVYACVDRVLMGRIIPGRPMAFLITEPISPRCVVRNGYNDGFTCSMNDHPNRIGSPGSVSSSLYSQFGDTGLHHSKHDVFFRSMLSIGCISRAP